MATPSSETADDSDPLYTGSESADEPHGVSAQSQGVLRVDSGASDQQEVTSEERSSSDQQIAENFELPVELRLSYKPPTVSLQGLYIVAPAYTWLVKELYAWGRIWDRCLLDLEKHINAFYVYPL